MAPSRQKCRHRRQRHHRRIRYRPQRQRGHGQSGRRHGYLPLALGHTTFTHPTLRHVMPSCLVRWSGHLKVSGVEVVFLFDLRPVLLVSLFGLDVVRQHPRRHHAEGSNLEVRHPLRLWHPRECYFVGNVVPSVMISSEWQQQHFFTFNLRLKLSNTPPLYPSGEKMYTAQATIVQQKSGLLLYRRCLLSNCVLHDNAIRSPCCRQHP